MDLSQAAAHHGLSAIGTPTRHGISWDPRIGPEAERLSLPDADVAVSAVITLPAAASYVLNFPALTGSGNDAFLEISIADVTGTDAALVNGTYALSATLVNGCPTWTRGNAVIRMGSTARWEIVLSGVVQFRAAAPHTFPSDVSTWEDAGAAGTGGTPAVTLGSSGGTPVQSAVLPADFEGIAAPNLASLRGLHVRCTAGSGLCSWGGGVFVLPTGGFFLTGLPVDGQHLLEDLQFLASVANTVIEVSVLGVAVP
jgi:hypothetical protein